ncbi:MAG: pyridoxal-phosphate dependent enzyme, partial [Gammaproteobacteria bacterium]|nr:pyridoxal-phosphate dependent enzyme [Gammaproteobacteria bacterium]
LLAQLSERTFRIIRNHVDRMVAVSEAEIVAAMRLIWDRMTLIAEPSAAVPLAAILSGAIGARGTRIGIVLSGGNADLDALPWTAQR